MKPIVMPPWGFRCNGLVGARTASSWLEVHFDPALVVDGCCYCLSLSLSFCLLLQCTAAFYLFASSVRTGVIAVVILFVVTMYRSFFFYLCASGFRCWDRRHIVVISYVVTMYCSFFLSLCLWFSMFGQASFLNEREVMRRTGKERINDFLRSHCCYDLLKHSGKV